MQYKKTLLCIWGKTNPFHPLLFHLIDVGIYAQKLLSCSAFKSIKWEIHESNHLTKTLNSDILNSFIALWCAFHDIGKCHPRFQAKAKDEVRTTLQELDFKEISQVDSTISFQHSHYSAKVIDSILSRNFRIKNDIATIRHAIRGHHGNFSRSEQIDDTSEEWKLFQNQIFSILQQYFIPHTYSDIQLSITNHSQVGIQLAGLLVLADWLASNDNFREKPYDTLQDAALEDGSVIMDIVEKYAKKSEILAEAVIHKMGFNSSIHWETVHHFSDLYPQFSEPNIIQQAVQKLTLDEDFLSKNALVIIEAPMGLGKTEAALLLASQWMRVNNKQGLYFALPTAATSNQMYSRVLDLLKTLDPSQNTTIKLIHGTSWMLDSPTSSLGTFEINDGYEIEKTAQRWFNPKRRAIINPYAVGTVDQAMLTIMNVKFGFLRLWGLAGKILIIDEVHAYDAYMGTIIHRLVKWAKNLNIPIILLSATLPNTKKNELLQAYSGVKDPITTQEDYPLITIAQDQLQPRYIRMELVDEQKSYKVSLEFGGLDNSTRVIELVNEILKRSQNVVILCNTIGNAQNFYNKLKSLFKNVPIRLFHSRFTPKDRNKIENSILSLYGKNSQQRPKASILVATQVVEQSLDIDFDCMITELAPIDLIIQRMGRVWRHNYPERDRNLKIPHIFILSPNKESLELGKSGRVYQKYLLYKTLAILEDRLSNSESIQFPKDIRGLVEEVYSDDYSLQKSVLSQHLNEKLSKTLPKYKENLAKDSAEAHTYLITPPNNREFDITARRTDIFDEDSTDSKKYLHAKTRLGEYTTQILAVFDTMWIVHLQKETKPSYTILKEIHKSICNLPKYWFKKPENYSEEDSKWIIPNPNWMFDISHTIFFELETSSKQYVNKYYNIGYSTELGFYKLPEEEMS